MERIDFRAGGGAALVLIAPAVSGGPEPEDSDLDPAIALASHRDAQPPPGLGAWDRLAEVTAPRRSPVGSSPSRS